MTTTAKKSTAVRPTVLMARKQTPIWSLKNFDDRLVIVFFGVSILGHTLFFVVEGLDIFSHRKVMVEEWVMDAEIISDIDFAASDRSAIDNAKEAEEVKVRENLLPQLTKTFSVKEDTVPEETVAEEKIVEEKKEEKKEAAKPEKTEDLKIQTKNKEDNKLDQREAKKRLAMQALIDSNKTAKTNEAEVSSDDIANKILNNLKGGVAGGSARGKQIIGQYVGMVRRAVHGNYSLPDAYNLKGAAMEVTLLIVVSARGDITKLEIEKGSGDRVFDDLTINAVKASSPLPKPPEELVGEKIYLNFKP